MRAKNWKKWAIPYFFFHAPEAEPYPTSAPIAFRRRGEYEKFPLLFFYFRFLGRRGKTNITKTTLRDVFFWSFIYGDFLSLSDLFYNPVFSLCRPPSYGPSRLPFLEKLAFFPISRKGRNCAPARPRTVGLGPNSSKTHTHLSVILKIIWTRRFCDTLRCFCNGSILFLSVSLLGLAKRGGSE